MIERGSDAEVVTPSNPCSEKDSLVWEQVSLPLFSKLSPDLELLVSSASTTSLVFWEKFDEKVVTGSDTCSEIVAETGFKGVTTSVTTPSPPVTTFSQYHCGFPSIRFWPGALFQPLRRKILPTRICSAFPWCCKSIAKGLFRISLIVQMDLVSK